MNSAQSGCVVACGARALHERPVIYNEDYKIIEEKRNNTLKFSYINESAKVYSIQTLNRNLR